MSTYVDGRSWEVKGAKNDESTQFKHCKSTLILASQGHEALLGESHNCHVDCLSTEEQSLNRGVKRGFFLQTVSRCLLRGGGSIIVGLSYSMERLEVTLFLGI